MSSLTDAFMVKFQRKTEERWKVVNINTNIYGFQFQPGTKWNSGLSESEITEYETKLGGQFSDDLRTVFRHINGTDRLTLNIYGNSGEPYQTDIGVYSYPRDIEQIIERIEHVRCNWEEIKEVLKVNGFEINENMLLVPFYIHRYVLCRPNRTSGPVLSIHGTDAIVYADSLRQYLEMEFLKDS